MREPRSQAADFQSWDGNRGLRGKLSPPAQTGHSGDATECSGDAGSAHSNSWCRDRDPGQGRAVPAAGARSPRLTHRGSRDLSADHGVGAGPAGKCSLQRPAWGWGRVRPYAVVSAFLRFTLPVPSGRGMARRSETEVTLRREPKSGAAGEGNARQTGTQRGKWEHSTARQAGLTAKRNGAWSPGIGVGKRAGRASSSSLRRTPFFPPPPALAGLAHGRAFGGLSNCLHGPLPPPHSSDCALSARPPRCAQARPGGAGRAAATLRNAAE